MEFDKRFGIVTVAPNEYVIHTRFGKVVNQGLGQTFFSLPYIDSYIKFTITPRKINFYADNITQEKQGVGIDGFLIWSIENGDKAYKKISMLDQVNTPIGEDPISSQLIDICISITRHAISNMELTEVLTNREALVERLSNQLTKVIVDWGLKIEAIEIKEVRVLSETLFENMQAPFRNEQLKVAEHSRLEAEKSISNTDTDTRASIRIRKAEQELEARTIEIDNQTKQKEIEHDALLKDEERLKEQKIKALETESERLIREKELNKQQALLDQELIVATEQAKRTVQKEQSETVKSYISLKSEEDLTAKENEIVLKQRNLEFEIKEREEEIKYKKALMEVQNNISQEALMQVLFQEMGNSMSNMNFDNINWYSMGDNSPMNTLPKAVIEIVTMLKSAGILGHDNLLNKEDLI